MVNEEHVGDLFDMLAASKGAAKSLTVICTIVSFVAPARPVIREMMYSSVMEFMRAFHIAMPSMTSMEAI